MKIRLHDRPVNTAWVRALWLVIALLLLAGGIFSVTRHEENLVSASRILGGIMFAAGFLNFSVCEGKNRKLHGAHWLMADGLVAVFLSLFPLFNQMTQPLVIPFFFGVWELVSGILKIMDSAELKAEKLRCWMGFAFIGAVELLSGGMSMIKPIDDLVGINKVIAIIFFVQSAGFFLKALMAKDIITE